MASDNNVVRLKHIKSLAQTVEDKIADITLQGGSSQAVLPHNADFALYVPNDTSIIITGKQTPIFSLGSWSAVDTVYSAPIIYNGDGSLSTDIGTISNDILTVADDVGSFNGVISVSADNDFASSSLFFNYDTKISDNSLDRLLNDDSDFFVFESESDVTLGGASSFLETPFLNGATTIYHSLSPSNTHYIFSSADNSKLSLGSNSTNSTISPSLIKLSESAGFVILSEVKSNSDYKYRGVISIQSFALNANASITTTQYTGGHRATVCTARSSVASNNDNSYIIGLRTCLDNSSFFFVINRQTDEASYYGQYAYSLWCNSVTGYLQTATSVLYSNGIGSNYHSTPNAKLLLNSIRSVKLYSPVINFTSEQVTIAKGSIARFSPFVFFTERLRDSPDVTVDSVLYVPQFLKSNYSTETIFISKLTDFSDGAVSSINPWLEDDDNIILGVFRKRRGNNCYIVTYKAGTYNKSSWVNDAFNVWTFDFPNSCFVKLNKKLPAVIDDILC